MGLEYGTVVGTEIIENRDSDGPVRMLQVEMTAEDDIQDVEMSRQPGSDSAPQIGDQVLVVDVTESFRVAIASDDGIVPTANNGEVDIYSHDTTPEKLARIHLDEDGNISHELETDDGVIKLAGDSRNSSGVDDTITITAITDPVAYAWFTAVGVVVGQAPPTSITGKITSGSDKVKLP